MIVKAKDLEPGVYLDGALVISVEPCADGIAITRQGDIPLWRKNDAKLWVEVPKQNEYDKWLKNG
jgi:hypothetical protein